MNLFRRSSWFFPGGLLGLLVTAIVAISPSERATAAPPVPLPAELQYVPHDAAFFLHADVATILSSELVKPLRNADNDVFARLEKEIEQISGSKLADIKTVTLFFPSLKKGERDAQRFGVAIRFARAFDQRKFQAGIAGLLPGSAKLKVLAPEETLAVVLVNLSEEFGKPQPADVDWHLTPAIKAAASGKHTIVVGSTLGNLPDEVQDDDLPPEVQSFKPILQSRAVYGTIDLGKSLAVNIHVRAKRGEQAMAAEKAISLLVDLLTRELGNQISALETGAAKDPVSADLAKALKAALVSVKGAKVRVDGNEVQLTAALPLNGLPLGSVYLASLRKVKQVGGEKTSLNNLKQIALAMHSYESANETFPAAAICDKKGKPLLSWRVAILPYIEQNALYNEFKLDEPWDSEHNKKLLAKMPPTYRLPDAKPDSTETHYRVFVGKGAAFDWDKGTKIAQITDGLSNTLMVVTAAQAVPWTKPDELEYNPEKDPSKLIGFVVNGKAQVAMCDGSVRNLSKLPSKTTLHALITRAGGEVIGDDF